MNIISILLCFANVLFDGFSLLVTGTNPLLTETFPNQIIPKATIIMTTKWPCFVHFSSDLRHIPGSLIFTIVVKRSSQYGFIIDGYGLAIRLLSCLLKVQWVGTIGYPIPLSFGCLMLLRYFVGSTNFNISYNLHFLHQLFTFTKFIGEITSIILCGKENVTYFLSTSTKKYTLFNLAQIVTPPKQPALAPPTPTKMETSSSTKGSSHSSGLTQRQKDLLEALKEELALHKAYLQKLMAEDRLWATRFTGPVWISKKIKERARKGLGIWQKQGSFVF